MWRWRVLYEVLRIAFSPLQARANVDVFNPLVLFCKYSSSPLLPAMLMAQSKPRADQPCSYHTTPLPKGVSPMCNLYWFLSWLINAQFLLSLSLVKHLPFSVSLSSPLYMPITEHRFSSRVLRNHLISSFQSWWPLATSVASYAPWVTAFVLWLLWGAEGLNLPLIFQIQSSEWTFEGSHWGQSSPRCHTCAHELNVLVKVQWD